MHHIGCCIKSKTESKNIVIRPLIFLWLAVFTWASPDLSFQYMLPRRLVRQAVQRSSFRSSPLATARGLGVRLPDSSWTQNKRSQLSSVCDDASLSTTRRPTPTKLFSVMPDINDDAAADGSSLTPYERWVRRLYKTNLFHPVKLGLQNIQDIHDALGNPMDQVPVVHIAGTNGKGSVALKIAATLQLLNPSLSVGLFCSPHVSSFRERMQVNGELISEEQVVEYLPEIYRLCEENDIPATFFEITTALAFMHFSKSHVVVLETGLGGRLDATNVIKAPTLSVITSIGLEHTRILGDTIEKIALEKGGIIKANRPVLVGPTVPHEVLRECAQEKQASEYLTCEDVLGTLDREITDYDEENARTATAALTVFQKYHPDLFAMDKEIVKQGTLIRPPCRFEIVERDESTVILDVAHNPPAMEYLLLKLESTYPDRKVRIVVGMSSDKDLKLVGSMLLNCVSVARIHLVEAYHPRAAKLEAMLDAEPRLAEASHYNMSDRTITTQIKSALELSQEKEELLVVCGSVFLMAEAREALGFDEPRDSKHIAEVAGANLRHGQEVFGNTTTIDEK